MTENFSSPPFFLTSHVEDTQTAKNLEQFAVQRHTGLALATVKTQLDEILLLLTQRPPNYEMDTSSSEIMYSAHRQLLKDSAEQYIDKALQKVESIVAASFTPLETRLRAIEEHNAKLDGKVTNLSVKIEDLHREIQGANKRSREVAESLAMILELHTFRLDEIKKAVEPAHTDAIDFDEIGRAHV